MTTLAWIVLIMLAVATAWALVLAFNHGAHLKDD